MASYTYVVNIDTPKMNGNLIITEDSPIKAYEKYREKLEESNGIIGDKVMPFPNFLHHQVEVKKGSISVLINSRK